MLDSLLPDIKHFEFNHQIDQEIKLVKQKVSDLLLPFSKSFSININLANRISSSKLFISKLLLTSNKIIKHTRTEYINHEQLIIYCTIIELINIATKIHNKIQHNAQSDQVNISNLHFFYTNISITQAILLGDAIYTLAFEQMIAINKQEILKHFVQATKDMAFYEAKLSEYLLSEQELPSDQGLLNIINLVEQKFWPLYSSVIFILDKIYINKPAKIDLYIQNINTIHSLNKIINKKIIFNPAINDFIYRSALESLELLRNNLNTTITATQKIASEINSNLL